jgi:hypothetical protein
MNSVINGIVAILMLLGAGTLTSSFYHAVKKEAVVQVNRGIHTHLTGFTQKLTGTKLKY